jgi:hypothetical protein
MYSCFRKMAEFAKTSLWSTARLRQTLMLPTLEDCPPVSQSRRFLTNPFEPSLSVEPLCERMKIGTISSAVEFQPLPRQGSVPIFSFAGSDLFERSPSNGEDQQRIKGLFGNQVRPDVLARRCSVNLAYSFRGQVVEIMASPAGFEPAFAP